MDDMQNHLMTATSLVAVMFGLLCAIMGWVGNRVSVKLDELDAKISAMASELHTRINQIDNRVTKLETRCAFEHNK